MTLPLFDDDDDEAGPGTPGALRPTGARPRTKKELGLDRLLARVQSLRERLDRERRRLDDALVFHAAQVAPRAARLTGLRTETVQALAPFLDDSRLKAADRRRLLDILSEQIDEILAHDPSPPAPIQDLFQRIHGIGYEDAIQEGMAEAQDDLAQMLADMGLDIDIPELRPDMSAEDMAAAAAQMAERLHQQEEARAAAAPRRRKTKREMREEARVEQMRKVGIGATYRRLARTLHPDLEPDPALRERKNAAMQELTTAYARNDLHTVLRLESEWVHGDQQPAAVADETLAAYTRLLKEQAAELDLACMELSFHPRYAALVVEGPLGMPVLLDGPAEVDRLDRAIDGIRAGLERLMGAGARDEVRSLLDEHRRARGRIRRR